MELYHNSRKNTTIFPEKEKWKKCKIPLYKQANTCYNSLVVRHAPVAQWIEHRIPVPRVGGSSPFRRTKKADTHLGICFFDLFRGRDSKDKIPQSGGLWAAPAGRRRTLQFANGKLHRVPSGLPRHRKAQIDGSPDGQCPILLLRCRIGMSTTTSKYHPHSKLSAYPPLAPSGTCGASSLPEGAMGCVPFHTGLYFWESACCGIPQSRLRRASSLWQGSLWVRYRYRAGQGSNEQQKSIVRIDSGGTPPRPVSFACGKEYKSHPFT